MPPDLIGLRSGGTSFPVGYALGRFPRFADFLRRSLRLRPRLLIAYSFVEGK